MLAHKSGITSGLVLVTGATGSGKTSLVVSWLSQIADRPVFVQGIPDLLTAHEPAPPVADWWEDRPSPEDSSLSLPYFRLPANSLLVVDEAQRVFPPRPQGSRVPGVVGALSTRRHTGLDMVLITQHPQLLDVAVRKLVTHHYHVHSTAYGSFLLYWVGVGEPSDRTSRDLAERTRYKPDPSTFALYKSAEAHTRKPRRIPKAAVIGGLLSLLAGVGLWYSYQSISAKVSPVAVDQPVKVAPVSKPLVSASAPSSQSVPVTAAEYLAVRQPRIQGLAHTAPVYDGITQPVVAPYPLGCIRSRTDCRCYDQRGGHYSATPEICRQIADGRVFFRDWVPDDSLPSQVKPSSSRELVQSGPEVGVISRDAGMRPSLSGPTLNAPSSQLPNRSSPPGQRSPV